MIYDVAVVGGGRAGAAAARTLAAGGVATLLVDRRSRRRVGESLVPAARTLLAELGAWEAFTAGRHLPCHANESFWGGQSPSRTDFIRSPHGPAWHLDGPALDRSLRDAARAAGATVWTGTSFAGIERKGGIWRLVVRPAGAPQSPREIRTRFVVDATGRGHRVARALGARRRWDDRLIAFEARFRAETEASRADHDTTNRVEATADGWWYTAPIPADGPPERTAVFFTDADDPSAAAARSGAGFLELLERAPAVEAQLTGMGYAPASRPRPTDARSSILEPMNGDGWLAIGDAATAFDPLSSQGIFTALYAGVRGGRAVTAALSGGAAALAELEAELARVYARFRQNQERIYRLERRWPRSGFWRSRQRPSA